MSENITINVQITQIIPTFSTPVTFISSRKVNVSTPVIKKNKHIKNVTLKYYNFQVEY